MGNEIKAFMQEQDTGELTAGQYFICWPIVPTNRFDTTAFKKILPDLPAPTPSRFLPYGLPSVNKTKPSV